MNMVYANYEFRAEEHSSSLVAMTPSKGDGASTDTF